MKRVPRITTVDANFDTIRFVANNMQTLLLIEANWEALLAGGGGSGGGGGGSGGPVAWMDITDKPLTFAPSVHSHVIGDVTGLQDILDGKQTYSVALTNTTAAFTTALESKLAGIAAGAQVNVATDLSYTAASRVLASSTGADVALPLVDSDPGLMSAADKTKLDGITGGATVNSPDAALLARGNHTGSQVAATISDLAEAIDDRVAALLVAGANVTITYDDVANTITIASTGGGGGGGDTAYDHRFGFKTAPTSAEVLDTVPIVRAMTIPANMAGSRGRVGTNPSNTFTMTLRKNGTAIGSIAVSTSGIMTFSTTGGVAQSLTTTDVISLEAPGSVDATIANMSCVILGETT